MSDELYQRSIVDLARAGHGSGRLDAPQASVVVDNPLCGDRITLELSLSGGRVSGLAHKARGCLLCQAAASAIGRRAPGESPAALRELARRLTDMVARDPAATAGLWPELRAFAPVHRHRSRHDCVLLPFQALRRALERAEAPAPGAAGEPESPPSR